MRAFIAIDLPTEVRAQLGRHQTAFRAASPDARWIRPEGIHLTLKFLGEVSPEQVERIKRQLTSLDRVERFSVQIRGFGFFPDARRPRVFWAGVEGPPQLGQLATAIDAAMEKLGFAPESRPYTSHVTLARFKVPRAQPALQELIGEQPGAEAIQESPALGQVLVSEFFLFESKLSPQGAEYRKVERIVL